MAKRLYVGNLGFKVTAAELRELFSAHGVVQSVQLQEDPATGKIRGFGFVVMAEDDAADEAIDRIDGSELHGRRLNVNEAQPRPPLPPPRGDHRGPGPGYGPRPGFGPGPGQRGENDRFRAGPGRAERRPAPPDTPKIPGPLSGRRSAK